MRRSQAGRRYLGVLLGLLQGLSYYALLRNGFGGKTMLSNTGVLAAVTIIVTFTAGTALIMWMGEQITEKGIGNGISDHPVRRYRFPRSVSSCVTRG